MLHFIEVKATNTANSAIYRITPAKMTKILRTIEFYFLRKGIMCAYEIDALCIDKDKVELQGVGIDLDKIPSKLIFNN